MKHVSVVEAKSRFSALLAEVEAGEEIAVTRHGKIVARLAPYKPRSAAELFEELWVEGGLDIEEPDDPPPDDAPSFD